MSEKRRNARSGLRIIDLSNMFFLLTSDEVYPITHVRDVSISGVGLEISQTCDIDNKVSLKYDSADLQLTIDGTVKWCKKSDISDGVHLGIEFDPGNGDDNSLFFLALRKYLDDFDCAYIDA